MRRFITAAALAIGLALAVAPAAMASPSHTAVKAAAKVAATTCRSNIQWEVAEPPIAYLYGDTFTDTVYVETTATTWCQFSSGYSLNGFSWFEYQDPNTGLCMTYNASATDVDEVTCQGLASQEWTATDQHGCAPNGDCLWAVGNAWVLIHQGNGYALNDIGLNSSPNMYTFQGNNDLYQNWWALVV